jgi:hypothetical protein
MDDFSGLYQVWLAVVDLISDVVGEDSSGHPLEITLQQNYPNPFNPSTTIQYQLPTSGFVSLNIFDVLGNRVATLVSSEQRGGSHSITFSPEKDVLASGVYLVRLQQGSRVVSRKILYLR